MSWRISVGYVLGFFVSCLLVGLFAVQVIRESDASADREEIQDEFELNSAHYAKVGVQAYAIAARQEPRRQETVLVRISDVAGRTVVLLRGFAESADESIQVAEQLQSVRRAGWHQLTNIGPNEKSWQVYAGMMPDGLWMQVAKSDHQWQQSRRRLAQAVLPIFGFVTVIALGGAAFLTKRTLRPIRSLIDATRHVIQSGDMTARVPERKVRGDELDELTKLFNQMLTRNEALICGMREALDNVVHDLRTPLTRLRSGIESALRAHPPTIHRQGEALLDAVGESEHTLAILRTLTDISEAEYGTMRLHLESLPLFELVSTVVNLYEHIADERKIAIEVAVQKELTVCADRVRLQQVIANLLDNALKYSHPGANVIIEGGRSDELGNPVWLSVRDEGKGIADHDLPRIWDRLYRADQSRSEYGSGLGLSLVKAVVEAHGGSVEVISTPDVGSTFTVRFASG